MTAEGDAARAPADGDLQADYEALRHGVGAHGVERDVVLVTGPEAEAYLQGQLSQDVLGMAAGTARDALLLEPDGKLCALVRVTRLGEARFAIDVEDGYGEAVAARLRRFRLRTKADLDLVRWPMVALRGTGVAAPEGAPEGPPGEAPSEEGPWVLPVSWNGATGVDVLGPGAGDALPAGARWCGTAAWESLRVGAGIPAMGRELDGRTIAAEADLVARTVSLTKGCYTGQELVARLDARGNRVARRLRGLVAAARVAPGAAPFEAGTILYDRAGGKPVGTCTSAAWCPGVGTAAGLGYVHRSVDAPGAVAAGAPGGPAVEVRPLPLVTG